MLRGGRGYSVMAKLSWKRWSLSISIALPYALPRNPLRLECPSWLAAAASDRLEQWRRERLERLLAEPANHRTATFNQGTRGASNPSHARGWCLHAFSKSSRRESVMARYMYEDGKSGLRLIDAEKK